MKYPGFDGMASIGALSMGCLKELKALISPGITTEFIDQFVLSYQQTHSLSNSQKNYMGFPAHCCVAPNEVVCHGVPSKKFKLSEGDIVGVDVTFNLDGWHGDCCWTYPVGEIDEQNRKLIDISKQAVKIGIEQVIPGRLLSDIGEAIEAYVESQGARVFRDYCGHSIGRLMHMSPQILNHRHKSSLRIVPGMMFTIEPIITFGDTLNRTDKDGWTVRAVDGKPSAQFEVTLGVDDERPIIFTDIFQEMDI